MFDSLTVKKVWALQSPLEVVLKADVMLLWAEDAQQGPAAHHRQWDWVHS
jgi:hypothetical protein